MGCLTCKLPSSSAMSPIDFCIGEIPVGLIDCDNLIYTTGFPFYPGSLEIYLDGVHLLEFEYAESIDKTGFTLILSPTDARLLASAARKSEFIRVNYIKASGLGTVDDCIVYL